jgi:CRP-like cAMP-binding protein
VINTGDIADCCYFIKEGRVKVCQQIDDEYLTVAYLAKVIFLVKKVC